MPPGDGLMSVGKRIAEALQKMSTGDSEGALIPTSIAVDATAQKQFPHKKNNESYKRFIGYYLPTITRASLGGLSTAGLRFGYSHPDIKATPDGTASIEQILYHLVRCGLLHNARLPKGLSVTSEGKIGVENGILVLPDSLVLGLLLAVVVSPVNANEAAPDDCMIEHQGQRRPLNEFWGRKDKLDAFWAALAGGNP